MGRPGANPEKPSQFGLHSATRVHEVESLVIADQHAAVNTFPGLVHTARHAMGVGFTRRRFADPKGGQPTTVRSATGAKS